MTGPISPMEYVWGMLFVFIIICSFSFGKNKTLRTGYLILSFLVVISGLVVIITLKSTLKIALNRPHYEASSVEWLVGKYDEVFKITMMALLIMFIILMLLLFIFIKTRKYGLLNMFSGLVIFAKVIIFIMGFYLSLESINKVFDLGSYIAALTISEIAILHILLIVKNIFVNIKVREKKELLYD
ncbi:hypothetical protein GCM10023142_02140 [Anaerocolumna aminovalerica]|uniref:Uncharacterized protein n=1 Tax=Anaerocolumna aminovalerica TaxID=1527 RepID=A0A1I5BL36_9FIRM|nr:hypothetical protein [Anaerocolumna aminovalerica]SFN75413.1 hypothetical protein SAMN04489757_10173 [Anaerocolumna aminovalerica]